MNRLDRIEETLDKVAKLQAENAKAIKEEREAREASNAAWDKQMKESREAWDKAMKEEREARKASNAAWDKQMKESREAWDKQMKESIEAWDKQMKESREAWEKQMKEEREAREATWDKEMKEERRLRKEVNKKLEGYISVGSDLLEDLFYRAADREIDEQGFIQIGQIAYDFVDKNVKGRLGLFSGEYDLVFYNSFHILIVEVKRKLRFDDFKQVLKHQETFPNVYSQYQNFQIHLGIASETFPPNLLDHAKQTGIYLLQTEADKIQVIAP